MADHLQRIADLSVFVFVVSTMLTVGMSQPLAEIIAPLRKPLTVALALLINFALAPLLAIALCRLVPLQPAHASGIVLAGAAAGAPFLPKLAAISRGDEAYSAALMMLLMAGSIVFMPLALPLMLPGVSADPWTIAKPLLLSMVAPLAIGFALALSGISSLSRLIAFTRATSNASFLLVVVLMIGLNFKTIANTLGSFAIGTYALYLLVLVAAGYLVGATDKSTQTVFALGAASRNIPAGLVVAGGSLNDPAITSMLIVAFVVSLVVLLGLARAMRPQGGARTRERLVT